MVFGDGVCHNATGKIRAPYRILPKISSVRALLQRNHRHIRRVDILLTMEESGIDREWSPIDGSENLRERSRLCERPSLNSPAPRGVIRQSPDTFILQTSQTGLLFSLTTGERRIPQAYMLARRAIQQLPKASFARCISTTPAAKASVATSEQAPTSGKAPKMKKFSIYRYVVFAFAR